MSCPCSTEAETTPWGTLGYKHLPTGSWLPSLEGCINYDKQWRVEMGMLPIDYSGCYGEPTKFICQYCGASFLDYEELRDHIASAHPPKEEIPTACMLAFGVDCIEHLTGVDCEFVLCWIRRNIKPYVPCWFRKGYYGLSSFLLR